MLKESGSTDGVEASEEYKSYEEYATHEAASFGRKVHSADSFLKTIHTFHSTHFDLESHPIKAAEFGKLSSGEPIYYICDGSHRAAYAAAYNDVMEASIEATVTTQQPLRHWPDIKSIIFGDTTLEIGHEI